MRRSPLEQFEIVRRRMRFSNIARIRRRSGARILGAFGAVMVNGNGTIVPNRWQVIFEFRYQIVGGMITQTVGPMGEKRYPWIYTRFVYVLCMNRRGLIPYSYTVTSHLIVTMTLALAVWVGKLLIGVRLHGRKIRSLFLPAGTPVGMIPLMVPLEILGFTITFISLSVRLFANMMAGHILLKVIAGFAWTMMASSGVLYLGHFIPMIVLVMLYALETGVAFVQAYVFALLTCIYRTDMMHGSH